MGLFSDNTTALSWMSVASRTPDPFLQGLARLGSALLVQAARLLTKVIPIHIAGKENWEADALSRPDESHEGQVLPMDIVIQQWSRLQTCRAYLIPSKILTIIASICSTTQTEEKYDEITTQLLNLEPIGLSLGAKVSDLKSTIFES